jgi:ankyrin repeat protein
MTSTNNTRKHDFWAALLHGHQVRRHLQEHAALANETAHNVLPLSCASFRNQPDNVLALLEYGAEPNRGHGKSALHMAVVQNHIDIVRILVEHGAQVNSDTSPPLSLAVSHGHSEITALLLQHGADPNSVDAFGITPLLAAIAKRRLDLVQLLLQYKAKVNASTTVLQQTPLFLAILSEQVDMVQLLIEHGADVSVQDPRGCTPLFMAISKNQTAMVHLLLKHGADTDTKNWMGSSPLLMAVKKGNCDMVQALLQHNAAAVIDDNKEKNVTTTPLFVAMALRQSEIVSLLVENGAHLHSTKENSVPPFVFAAQTDNLDALYSMVRQSPQRSLLADHVRA